MSDHLTTCYGERIGQEPNCDTCIRRRECINAQAEHNGAKLRRMSRLTESMADTLASSDGTVVDFADDEDSLVTEIEDTYRTVALQGVARRSI